jgi:hypothetical protein
MRIEVDEMERLDCEEKLVEIFEVEQGKQIENDAKGKEIPAPGRAFRRGTDGTGYEVVDQYRAEQEEDVEGVPCGVKQKRHRAEPGDDRASAIAPQQVEAEHGDRQKFKQKRKGIKEHKYSRSVLSIIGKRYAMKRLAHCGAIRG